MPVKIEQDVGSDIEVDQTTSGSIIIGCANGKLMLDWRAARMMANVIIGMTDALKEKEKNQ